MDTLFFYRWNSMIYRQAGGISIYNNCHNFRTLAWGTAKCGQGGGDNITLGRDTTIELAMQIHAHCTRVQKYISVHQIQVFLLMAAKKLTFYPNFVKSFFEILIVSFKVYIASRVSVNQIFYPFSNIQCAMHFISKYVLRGGILIQQGCHIQYIKSVLIFQKPPF